MDAHKPDRRIDRTRKLLRGALVLLIKEKGYNAVTIHDITERANVGRTTFYQHYQTKEDLLLDHHAELSAHFSLSILSYSDLLGDTPQREMIAFLELMAENRPMYLAIRAAKDAEILERGMHGQIAARLQDSLNACFPDTQPNIPMDALTEYIVGAQLSLIHWWMTNRTAYDAAQLALLLHRLRRAAICDAYGLNL